MCDRIWTIVHGKKPTILTVGVAFSSVQFSVIRVFRKKYTYCVWWLVCLLVNEWYPVSQPPLINKLHFNQLLYDVIKGEFGWFNKWSSTSTSSSAVILKKSFWELFVLLKKRSSFCLCLVLLHELIWSVEWMCCLGHCFF